MRLEHLCDMELNYRDIPMLGASFAAVRPYGSEEGSGYGEGDGTVTGLKLNGTVRWVNHPHRRSDQVMLPDAHGVIRTGEGEILLFHLQGRTHFVGERGQQNLLVLFETEAEKYTWLNTALCVFEGVIEGIAVRARVYVCINELV